MKRRRKCLHGVGVDPIHQSIDASFHHKLSGPKSKEWKKAIRISFRTQASNSNSFTIMTPAEEF